MSFADPLWEFVLEDYEDEESTLISKLSSRNKNKKTDDKSTVGSRSFLSSKRGNRSKYKDEKDGFWDMISGKPPAATRLKKSKSFSGRTNVSRGRNLRSKKSNPKTRSSSLTRSQSSISEPDTVNTDRKKSMFKKRFIWNQNHKSGDDSSMREYSAQKHTVKHTSLVEDRDDTKTGSVREDDSGFDPMDLLYQIADTLDPWGIESEASYSDVESHEGSVTDDEGDRSSYVTSNVGSESYMSDAQRSKSMALSSADARNKKLDSLLDQKLPLPNPTRFDSNRYPYQSKQTREENTHSTEIRLRVNPVGNTLSEEVYEKRTNIDEDQIKILRRVPSDEERYPMFTPSFDSDAFQSTSIYECESDQPDFAPKEKRDIDTSERRKLSFEETRIPPNARSTDRAQSNIRDCDGKGLANPKTPNGLKKAMCGMKKVGRDDLMTRFRKPDTAEVFPSSRILVDGESRWVPESGPVSGMMGPIIGSKGPVFAYDYESNMNMDVSYTKPNQNPKNSISVRKLGPPPPIRSILGADNIVIQVEASLVSETDCIVRQGLWWGKTRPSYPNTPGIDVVGKVYCTRQTTEKVYGLKPLQTVMSLVKWGGNSRFMTIHPKQLVKVPEGLDPADVACLPECYLSAFQVLHMGQTGKNRYRKNSLKGKSILILGCMTNNMGKAMIELAQHAGAANIYATAKKKHWKTLISYGVMPLSLDPMQFIQRIAGMIDLILAPNGNLREDVSPVHFRALVPRHGQLIISGHRIVGNDIPLDDWKKFNQSPTLSCGKNKALQKILRNSLSYDIYEEWERNLELCKRDLDHLLKLLESKSIKPEVLDRIPLNKVAKAHELLETKRLPGFLVCEPWIKSKKRAIYL